MINIQLLVAYDGTGYLGWQKTPMGPSIEDSLQHVLEKILQRPIRLQAASRTDAGVHANGQVVNFILDQEKINCPRLFVSLNQLLPAGIVVLDIKQAHIEFHPTLDCIKKEYCYYICCDKVQMPSRRLYSWHCPRLGHLSEMREAATYFTGKHDFSSLCNIRKQMHYDHYIREVYSIQLEELESKRMVFKIEGKNFLYKMVRNIVGTLVYVGLGKLTVAQVPKILSAHDRTQAGVTAPAHGLFLNRVFYP